jgi:hypothetical protein
VSVLPILGTVFLVLLLHPTVNSAVTILQLGWEFQFLVPISGTPIGGGIPIPITIPKIPVEFFFEIPISRESENWNSDLRFSEFWQFLAQELSTSFCC